MQHNVSILFDWSGLAHGEHFHDASGTVNSHTIICPRTGGNVDGANNSSFGEVTGLEAGGIVQAILPGNRCGKGRSRLDRSKLMILEEQCPTYKHVTFSLSRFTHWHQASATAFPPEASPGPEVRAIW